VKLTSTLKQFDIWKWFLVAAAIAVFNSATVAAAVAA